jgi:hypothetical protein
MEKSKTKKPKPKPKQQEGDVTFKGENFVIFTIRIFAAPGDKDPPDNATIEQMFWVRELMTRERVFCICVGKSEVCANNCDVQCYGFTVSQNEKFGWLAFYVDCLTMQTIANKLEDPPEGERWRARFERYFDLTFRNLFPVYRLKTFALGTTCHCIDIKDEVLNDTKFMLNNPKSEVLYPLRWDLYKIHWVPFGAVL